LSGEPICVHDGLDYRGEGQKKGWETGSLSKDMENDILQKEVKKFKHKATRSWQLLFVDNRGKIISHAWFKSTAIVILSALIISIFCSITFFFFFIKNRNENIDLQKRVETFESRMKALRNERDILLARLVLVESKLAEGSDQKPVLGKMPVESKNNAEFKNSSGKRSSIGENISKKE